jgi:hypothetical protein
MAEYQEATVMHGNTQFRYISHHNQDTFINYIKRNKQVVIISTRTNSGYYRVEYNDKSIKLTPINEHGLEFHIPASELKSMFKGGYRICIPQITHSTQNPSYTPFQSHHSKRHMAAGGKKTKRTKRKTLRIKQTNKSYKKFI